MRAKIEKDKIVGDVIYRQWIVNDKNKSDIISWCSDYPYAFEPFNGDFNDDEMIKVKIYLLKKYRKLFYNSIDANKL